MTSITAMVNSVIQFMSPRLDKPFALFGHSMGAIIGFEVARQLRREKRQQPLRLFASGRRAPQVRDQGPQSHKLSNADFIEALNKLNGTAPEALTNVELMELMLPTIRADFMAIETYNYSEESPLDCSITAYGGMQDHHVNHDHIDQWRAQTNNSFRLRWMNGDHFFINTHKKQLLEALSVDLEELLEKLERPSFPIFPRRITTDCLSTRSSS